MKRSFIALAATAAASGVVIAAVALAPLASASASTKCVVTDTTAGHTSTNSTLQAAVNAASPGDALTVSGTCLGDTSINEDLTITGSSGATLNGGNTQASPGTVVTIGVLHVPGGPTVTMTGLKITGGYAGDGGGVLNYAVALLSHDKIVGNAAASGGGIYTIGVLLLANSTVSGNTATAELGGGGLYEDFGGTATISHSTISANTASINGGAIYNCGGTVTLSDSTSVSNNSAAYGGGAYEDSRCNTYNSNDPTSLVLGNATMSGNSATAQGGAIYNYTGGTAAVELSQSASITNNTAPAAAGAAGGIYTTMRWSVSDADPAFSNVNSNTPTNIVGN